MTLRDLTKRQLYNLRRRSAKEMRQWDNINPETAHRGPSKEQRWQAAYDKGFKAAIELLNKIAHGG